MPRIIDHEVERRRIARATWEVLQQSGYDALTVRNIARQAGCTTGTLSHYFRNRGELIAFSYELVTTEMIEVIHRKLPRINPGLARLRTLLELLIPRKPKSDLHEISVTISSWVFALSDPDILIQHRKNYARLRELAEGFVREAIEIDEMPATTVAADIGDMMISFADGLCVAMMLEKPLFPTKRCTLLIDQFMLGLTHTK